MTTLQLPGGEKKVIVGNAPAWALSFHTQDDKGVIVDTPKITLSSDHYNARLDATLPGHLEGGTYSFIVEGLTDDDYALIAQRKGSSVPRVVKLFLFWQEANLRIGAYLNNMVGVTDFAGPTPTNPDFLVAVLWIKKVSRKAGTKRYETTIDAQELVFHQLTTKPTASVGPFADLKKAAEGVVAKATEIAKIDLKVDLKALDSLPSLTAELPAPAPAGAGKGTPAPKTAEAKGDDSRGYPAATALGTVFTDIAEACRQKTGQGGRGMLLIRDGTLYVGPRAIPFSQDPKKPGDPKDLTIASGLVADPTLKDTSDKDPTFTEKGVGADQAKGGGGAGAGAGAGADPAAAGGGGAGGAGAGGAAPGGGGGKAAGGGGPPDDGGTNRRQYEVVLKGRPDIKPGDVVRVDVPEPEQDQDPAGPTSFLGRLADATINPFKGPFFPDLGKVSDKALSLYVSSVRHQLGATTGFVTTLNGVKFDPKAKKGDPDYVWDPVPANAEADKVDKGQSRDASANPAVDVAKAVAQVAQASTAKIRTVDVAEVRKFVKSGDKDAEPPAQTETLWRGLGAGDGRRGQARRLPIERTIRDVVDGIAYATPFAWGSCGLILPRYPGTRVVVTHRNGDYTDPIEIGALWQSGHGPQKGELGDWWLILPVGASTPETLPDDDTEPSEHTGSVSNDLIDANGNRVIEVGEFTVRVGRNSLQKAGERPKRAEQADSITIEHADGKAKIVIDKNGGILIDAGTADITMKANNVKVQVQGTMDVSGGGG